MLGRSSLKIGSAHHPAGRAVPRHGDHVGRHLMRRFGLLAARKTFPSSMNLRCSGAIGHATDGWHAALKGLEILEKPLSVPALRR